MQCKFQNACLQDLSKEISKGRFLSKVGDSLILFCVSSNGGKKSKTDLQHKEKHSHILGQLEKNKRAFHQQNLKFYQA